MHYKICPASLPLQAIEPPALIPKYNHPMPHRRRGNDRLIGCKVIHLLPRRDIQAIKMVIPSAHICHLRNNVPKLDS